MNWTLPRCGLALVATLAVAVPCGTASRAATLMGSGITVSCGGWVEARRNNLPIKPQLEDWALGYLSGVAMWTPESPLDNLDAAAVFVWLENYCQSRPLEPFKAALDGFIRFRAPPPQAQPAPQPAPQPPGGGQPGGGPPAAGRPSQQPAPRPR